jgi:hypothetical protein
MKANNENMIRVFHLTQLTREERDRLNASDAGWSSEPRFSRYADITTGFSKRLADQVAEAWKLGEYHEAADVATDSLDWAFHQTNNISHVWNLNDDVEALTDCFKSTSVGDVMLKDGRFYVVAPVGFEPIDLIDIDLTEGDEPEITCGACTVAIGAHTNDENCRESKSEPFHFYATCVFGWATSEVSRLDALDKLATRFRADVKRIVAAEKKNGNGGMYFWSCRVLAPSDAQYKIEWFQPVGVETVDHEEHTVRSFTVKRGLEFAA